MLNACARELKAPKYKCEAAIIGVQGRNPWSECRRASPPETETLLAFGRSLKTANLPTLEKLKREISDTICVVFAKNKV